LNLYVFPFFLLLPRPLRFTSPIITPPIRRYIVYPEY
jgi:hypothetical protein